MSETQKAPVITRNEISLSLTPDVFTKKSPHAGKTYYKPVFTEAAFTDNVKWASLNWVVAVLNTKMGGIFRDLHIDNIDENTGVFDNTNWLKEATDFTEGVATLADIMESIDILAQQQSDYVQLPEFCFGEEDTAGVKTEKALETEALLREVSAKIKPLRAQKAKIEAIYKERAEKRKANKAKEEADKLARQAQVAA